MLFRSEMNTSALGRTRETQSQTGLTRHQRRANLRGAFVAARPEQIAGREIILVDDVYTTGTTVYECARALRRAGAAEIYTIAYTLSLHDALPILHRRAGGVDVIHQNNLSPGDLLRPGRDERSPQVRAPLMPRQPGQIGRAHV